MNEEFVIKKGVLVEYNGTDEVVTVPEGVRVIGESVFQPNFEIDGELELERLKKVIIPETVWAIDKHAFFLCYGLKEVELPSSLEVIGEGAFDSCDLKQIKLPDGLISIEERAFGGNASLEQVIIPPSVKRLDPSAFDGCLIEHILVPEHLREPIEKKKEWDEYNASKENTKREDEWYDNIEWYDAKQKIETLPETKPNYENGFWIEDDRLIEHGGYTDEAIVVPEGVRVIGKRAFRGDIFYDNMDIFSWEWLKEVKLPAGVEVIETEAFYKCYALEKIELPEELKTEIEARKAEDFKMTYLLDDALYIVHGFGMQETGGYIIQVQALYLAENAIYFETDLIGPENGAKVEKCVSYPYIVVKTERLTENVVFE